MGDDEIDHRRRSIAGSKVQIKSLSHQRSLSRLKMRRQSFGFTGVPGIRPVERTSQLGIEFKRPPLLYLNTYQLEPARLFHLASVTAVINELLDEVFTGHKYNAQESPAIAMRVAGDLMRRLKCMEFPRYRFITVVTLGQKRAQCFNNAITFLWDHERDGYANVQKEVNTAFIQVTAFGIYLD